MAHAPTDHHIRGEMEISEQQSTYLGFLVLSKWGSLAIICGVLFFALLFCTGAGFIASAASAIIVAVLGVLLLRNKKTAGH